MVVSRREFLYFSSVSFLLSKRSSVGRERNIRKRVQTAPHENALGVTKLCLLYESGQILFTENENVLRPPASIVKLMVLYMVSEMVKKGEVSLDTKVKLRRNIFPVNNSDIVISSDREYLLEDLIKAMAVISSNTSAIAVAEGIWGSEKKCIDQMNATAKRLGMSRTYFRTVNGFPIRPGVDADVSTGKELAILAMECCKSPLLLSWTSTKEFVIPGDNIVRKNTNELLYEITGCDGLKTGFTRSAGHCIIATAKRANTRVISIVMGANTSKERFRIAKDLLDIGFAGG
ncbi:MAG: D-alanyl-D-alanine carboxypeptidase [Candidatus Hydrogenedentes bacterium]|nr:D-alanyl-D-alanine carboxypeptidase [Candidatus Hydrogenedentota bacterium]